MRKGWRERSPLYLNWALVLALASTGIAQGALLRGESSGSDQPVRMTVEIQWDRPELPKLPSGSMSEQEPVDLEVMSGRIIDVLTIGPKRLEAPWCLGPEGSWRLGTERSGTVRARILAPVTSCLVVRIGNKATTFPVVSLLEAPQQSVPPAPAQIRVSRLNYDPIEVDPGTFEGIAAPGSEVSLTVGFNLLTPEPGEAWLRLIGKLRPVSGETARWEHDQTLVVATNSVRAPAMVLKVKMPEEEGTYILDLQATWEPILALEGSRIGRILRRRRTTWPGPTSASRKVSITVIDAKQPRLEPERGGTGGNIVVDSIDLSGRSSAFRVAASGRTPRGAGTVGGAWPIPEAALVEPQLRDQLRGWILGGPEADVLGPEDGTGLSWSAFPLEVEHPDRPHVLKIAIAAGKPEDLAIGLIDPGGGEAPPRVLLDAAATGEASSGTSGQSGVCSWPFWPGTSGPVLVLAHRGKSGPLKVGSITVEEVAGAWPSAVSRPAESATRELGVAIEGERVLRRFGGRVESGIHEVLSASENLADYMGSAGMSLVVIPDSLTDRSERRALEGQAAEDSTGADRLSVLLSVFQRRGLTVWLELDGEGPWPGLPSPSSPQAIAEGLTRLNSQGGADSHPTYNPMHPRVAGAMKARVQEAIARKSAYPNMKGLLIQMGRGPTVLGPPSTSLDDTTYNRFLTAMFDAETARKAPGREGSQPERFGARAEFLSGPAKKPWMTWRSQELGRLYKELAVLVSSASPDAMLAVATPTLDSGPAGHEARRADQANQSPLDAWEAVGLDFEHWQEPPESLVLLRAVGPGHDPLGRDLSTHPELDAPVARWYRRGLLQVPQAAGGTEWSARSDHSDGSGQPTEGIALTSIEQPAASGRDEMLGHALAVLDPRWVVVSATSAFGREESLATFSRILRSMPGSAAPAALSLSPITGAAARVWKQGKQTVVGLANDTPYTLRLDALVLTAPQDAPVIDIGRSLKLAPESYKNGRRLVLDLPPFAVAAVQIASPDARVESVIPHPLDDLEAEFRSLANLRDRLAQNPVAPNAPSSPFEPGSSSSEASDTHTPASLSLKGHPTLSGWTSSSNEEQSLSLDPARPHGGTTSLRLIAGKAPASIYSPSFVPPSTDEWVVRAFLRAERAGTPVRVWIEGKSGGAQLAQVATIEIGAEWAERIIRVGQLPPGGLEQARLRFEVLSPGTMWMDDLVLTDSARSDTQRRAQMVLTMALQAHREKRYADFARLATSHWVLKNTLTPSLAPALSTPLAEEGEGPDSLRTGDASDLPPNRRLR